MMSFLFCQGRNGVAITLVTQYDIHLINAIEEQIRKFKPKSAFCLKKGTFKSKDILFCEKSTVNACAKFLAVSVHSLDYCFVCLEAKLKEFAVEEKEVLKILTQVNVTRRQCEIVRDDFFNVHICILYTRWQNLTFVNSVIETGIH